MKLSLQSSVVNATLAMLALGLSSMAMGWRQTDAEQKDSSRHIQNELQFETLPDGTQALRDVDGALVPLETYQRIASGSILADHVLLELCDPTRIVAFTTYSRESRLQGYRFEGKPAIAAMDDIEAILQVKPQLLLLNTHTTLAKVERLRAAGVRVFNLGEMRGLDTFSRNTRSIAALIGEPARGERYLATFHRRLAAITSTLPEADRKTAMYLSVIGKQLYGGARGTSHSDVIRSAGLIDVASLEFEGWPSLSLVDVLELDPDFIVTHESGGEFLCQLPGAAKVRACSKERQGVIEGPHELWSDAGAGMLPAAEYLFERAYPRR
jgi:iron complex transport system substrate-binding protein